MASSVFTITAAFCSPNEGHTTLTASGALTGAQELQTVVLSGVPDADELKAALLVLCRWHVRNLSVVNKKAAAAAGIAFSITSTP